MAYPILRRDLRDWRAVCKVKPNKYQVRVATTNEVDDSAFQEEQRLHFQVLYEQNVDTSLRNPSGQFIECEDELESPTPILDEDADVDLILSGDEQNDDEAEYFSDEGDLDVNYY
ncbi:unnamed protein product [Amaranthus hypochondriacus]